VTRGKQWLHTELGLDVLDTPGILPPKINSPEAGWLLAAAGCIPDDLFPMEEVASRLLGLLASRGLIPFRAEMSPSEILEKFGRERGFLMRGGIPDVKKTSLCVLRSFRDGKFGRLTLEEPGGSDPAKFKRSLTPGINE
jgi:ribosome biogenesis GTPase A